MMKKILPFVFFIYFLSLPIISFASAALENQQRMKQSREQQILQQKKQAYQQAVEQKMMQQQQQAQQQAIYNQARQKQVKAYQQALQQRAAMAQQQMQSMQLQANASIHENIDPSEVKDKANIREIWAELERSSEVWPLIIENRPKLLTVQRFIAIYQKEGVTIRKSASEYVQMIDQIFSMNPEAASKPFKTVLMIAAVIQYDFDNGEDKDQLARRILGERTYQEIKKQNGVY